MQFDADPGRLHNMASVEIKGAFKCFGIVTRFVRRPASSSLTLLPSLLAFAALNNSSTTQVSDNFQQKLELSTILDDMDQRSMCRNWNSGALRVAQYSLVAAGIRNATIDDQDGDSRVTNNHVTYYPRENAWDDQTCGSNKCALVFDTSLAFDNTYTAGTWDPGNATMGINMQFNGTAIYVYFILANTIVNSANFTLDSDEPELYSYQPSATQYNATVFFRSNLPNTLHTLNISTTGLTPLYVNFDYAIYTYNDGDSTTTSSPSSLSTATTMSQAPSTTLTGAPARRTPAGAIVGGVVGGITLLALVISLLFCWHRRGGHDALRSIRGNGGPDHLMRQYDDGVGNLAVSASAMPYTQPLAVGSESPMASVTLPGSLGTSSNNRSASALLPSPLNVTGTREEVRRARQEDLDNRLRVVQHNIVQLEESSASSGRSVSLRRQTSGAFDFIEEEMQMSMLDMQEAIRSLKEQMRVLREQQQSAWAQGLSDDRPRGYTPMEGMQIPGEASSEPDMSQLRPNEIKGCRPGNPVPGPVATNM
ncbi:uncharacterized protein LACBIDRAFT_328857 [Laccaria bicolor S238N-H82]|uniref:Predicted protein n=1 Tax=Laccaria bicolor (strain S238N-H82 / ATCC MYA-4686) TaxID=486041 RepID=B0DG76_LACBS|nr:uncharacterized protein LACBIDRAFT_328857 [Laccaria bicolor S238N-H82]EDR06594.1 predicted protein [Laccaria bicolor S238N-H82]|eukprot:XP_001882966.1 predicted protein [Laccaria bicolor S238N-H82]